VDEAAAFVAAVLMSDSSIGATSLVVTEEAGWRFVEANPLLKVAVAAKPEIAERPVQRDGLITIIPYAVGDMRGQLRSTTARDDADVVLERPSHYDFETALVAMNVEKSDAARCASSTGRSWSVFRRKSTSNPALRSPAWLNLPEAVALTTVCLLGSWSADRTGDREVVEKVAGRAYEELERQLRVLTSVDDAPVIEIGTAWKAKAPIELLDLLGDRITSAELVRYFAVAEEILTTPDPELELSDEEGYLASIHGKVRPQSGLLIRALCDTLIKLAVRGENTPRLAAMNIAGSGPSPC
jgi:hypothetical protein